MISVFAVTTEDFDKSFAARAEVVSLDGYRSYVGIRPERTVIYVDGGPKLMDEDTLKRAMPNIIAAFRVQNLE